MKTSFISSIVILPIVLFVFVNTTTVNKCTSVDAPVPDVDIANCTTPPCVFYINGMGIMTMKFRAPRYLENIQPKALAHVLGLDIAYPLGQDDACEGVTNTPCPLAEGEYIEYTYEMPIIAIFPEVVLTLQFSLLDLDQDSEAFECFMVDLQLAKP